MSFANETPFAARAVPLVDAEGRDVLVVVVKATFAFDGQGNVRLADEQRGVRINDVPFDPASPRSSLRLASDVGLEKRGTDVVIAGDAVSPRPAPFVDVALMFREQVIPLRVYGTRMFEASPGGATIGQPLPFERMPIAYELAYGGASEDLAVVEPRNPSGVGMAKFPGDLAGTRAPQIVHPEREHRTAADRHPPVGFGPIPPHWSPRREHAGTLDERWKATRMPLPPFDLDKRFHNVAHPSLQLERHAAAGDPVRVVGMSLEQVGFYLPRFTFSVRARFDGGERTETRPPIDTLVILPEEQRVEMVGRAVLPMGRGQRVLREVVTRSHDD